MFINATFNIGNITDKLRNVVVQNIPQGMYKWTATVNEKGAVIMKAEVDMDKVYTMWVQSDCPVVLDCTDANNNKFANDTNNH